MTRNRFLFDLIGVGLGVATAYLIGFFIQPVGTGGSIVVTVGGILAGGGILGFFAYKNDGVKIAGIIFALIAVGGVVIGVLMFSLGEGFLEAFSDNVISAIIGATLTPVFIIIAIIMIVGGFIIGGLFMAAAAIGSAIGEAVWKDKQAELVDRGAAVEPYQPTQLPTYAPVGEPKVVQPAQPRSVVCPNCGASNPGTDKFCTNCGAQLK